MEARLNVVLTGASDGIGAFAAGQLTDLGHRVLIVGRSPEKTRAVAEKTGAEFLLADFADLDSVRRLAEGILDRLDTIDVLANNAGAIMGEREVTADGFEKTLQVNHLAPFLLTELLMDRLVESKARVVNTASIASRLYAKLDLDDLDNARRYTPNRAYGDAKLLNIIHAKLLHERHGLLATSFHPGVVATNFAAESTSLLRHLYRTAMSRFLATPEQGADTLVWLATARAGLLTPGGYYVKRRLATVNTLALDPQVAERVWEESMRRVGLK